MQSQFALLRFRSSVIYFSLAALCLFLFAGCEAEKLEYTEKKRISEKVSEREFRSFLRVIKSLPGKKLPEYPMVYAPPPKWETDRTLPVSELVFEEKNKIAQLWKTDWLAKKLPQSRALNRALKRQKMSREQFVALATTIGLALSRTQVRSNQNLDTIYRSGTAAIAKLNNDQKPFSEHSLDQQHTVLNEAVWIIRLDRVNHLRLVPPENQALVLKNFETLSKIFPKDFTENPFESIADLLDEKGLPFEESGVSGSDIEIGWDRKDAIIGNDTL